MKLSLLIALAPRVESRRFPICFKYARQSNTWRRTKCTLLKSGKHNSSRDDGLPILYDITTGT